MEIKSKIFSDFIKETETSDCCGNRVLKIVLPTKEQLDYFKKLGLNSEMIATEYAGEILKELTKISEENSNENDK